MYKCDVYPEQLQTIRITENPTIVQCFTAVYLNKSFTRLNMCVTHVTIFQYQLPDNWLFQKLNFEKGE